MGDLYKNGINDIFYKKIWIQKGGKLLLPVGLADTASYELAVFIDDDENHIPYILWGYTNTTLPTIRKTARLS